jgi:predicted DNA-binding transcriptional regulator AlpA
MQAADEFISAKEAMALLGVAPSTFHRYINNGVIMRYREVVGNRPKYKRAELEALKTRGPVAEPVKRASENPTQ